MDGTVPPRPGQAAQTIVSFTHVGRCRNDEGNSPCTVPKPDMVL
jgi:hypothetical protein